MRKRRHVLQVSTFPFLAVLLCAMGSLILLLLVIDRRAKVVAKAKAWQSVHRQEEEEARAESVRAAERERRQQLQRELAMSQNWELQTQIHADQKTIAGLAQKLEGER